MIKQMSLLLGAVIFGFVTSLVLHEFSHLVTLLAVNGELVDMKISSLSYVSGYVEEKYISIVAVSSVVIPLIISFLGISIKNLYVRALFASFTVSIAVNCILGLIAYFFENDSLTRATYDIALTIDFASYQTITLVAVCILTVLSLLVLSLHIKHIVQKIIE